MDHPKLLVIRLRRNGHLDKTFGKNGIFKANLKRDFESTSVAIQRNGKIVVGGSYELPKKGGVFGLVRITSSGRLDRSFFNRGVFAPSGRGLGVSATDVITDSSGRILAAGIGDQDLPVIRIKPQ